MEGEKTERWVVRKTLGLGIPFLERVTIGWVLWNIEWEIGDRFVGSELDGETNSVGWAKSGRKGEPKDRCKAIELGQGIVMEVGTVDEIGGDSKEECVGMEILGGGEPDKAIRGSENGKTS